MATFIPRANANVAAESTNNKRFDAQLCAKMVVSSEDIELIKGDLASVPTVLRTAIAGDVIVLATDKSGNYGTPRLRIDNTFKNNQVFTSTPNFTLEDILTEMTNDEGEIDAKKASAFAASKVEEYKKKKSTGKKAILAAIQARRKA